MKKWVPLILMTLYFAPVCLADLYWETAITTTLPDKDSAPTISIVKYYHTGDKLRIDSQDSIIITDFKSGKIYHLKPDQKLYMVQDKDDLLRDSETNKQVRSVLQQLLKNAAVEKQAKTRDIRGYTCTQYLVTVMGTQGEFWVTQDLTAYQALRDIAAKHVEQLKGVDILQDLVHIGDKLNSIEGFIMEGEIATNMISIRTSVLKVMDQKLDNKLFQLPEDYARMEIN